MPALYPLTRELVYTPPEVYGSTANEYCYPVNSAVYGFNGSDARRAYESADSYKGYAKQILPIRDSVVDHIPSAMAGFSSALDRRERIPSHMPAPILPPIRIPDTVVNAAAQDFNASSHAISQANDKDAGKATGGVAAQLDYEMEDMVDFVSDSAQGMYDLLMSPLYLADIDLARSIQPGTAISVAFRKYVSSILSSTRLPSSTIVLALHYLGTRVTLISTRPGGADLGGSTTHLHRMVTTALMLASKFLDDNTFQNRSWADVSHIPVNELNMLELNWLAAIGWSLHIDARDPAGFEAWRTRWARFQTRRETERKERAALSMESLKLTPPDAFPMRARQFGYLPPPTPATPAYTPYGSDALNSASSGWTMVDRPSPPWNQWPRIPRDTPPASAASGWSTWSQAQRRDQVSPTWSDWASSRRLTPPSAGTSGPATPEWYGRNGHGAFGGPPAAAAAHYVRPLPPPVSHLPSHHGAFDAQYGQFHAPAWGGHAMGCGCGYCVQPDRYAMGHGYAVQPVMG